MDSGQIFASRPRLLAPFCDGYLYSKSKLVLQTVTQYAPIPLCESETSFFTEGTWLATTEGEGSASTVPAQSQNQYKPFTEIIILTMGFFRVVGGTIMA